MFVQTTALSLWVRFNCRFTCLKKFCFHLKYSLGTVSFFGMSCMNLQQTQFSWFFLLKRGKSAETLHNWTLGKDKTWSLSCREKRVFYNMNLCLVIFMTLLSPPPPPPPLALSSTLSFLSPLLPHFSCLSLSLSLIHSLSLSLSLSPLPSRQSLRNTEEHVLSQARTLAQLEGSHRSLVSDLRSSLQQNVTMLSELSAKFRNHEDKVLKLRRQQEMDRADSHKSMQQMQEQVRMADWKLGSVCIMMTWSLSVYDAAGSRLSFFPKFSSDAQFFIFNDNHSLKAKLHQYPENYTER